MQILSRAKNKTGAGQGVATAVVADETKTFVRIYRASRRCYRWLWNRLGLFVLERRYSKNAILRERSDWLRLMNDVPVVETDDES